MSHDGPFHCDSIRSVCWISQLESPVSTSSPIGPPEVSPPQGAANDGPESADSVILTDGSADTRGIRDREQTALAALLLICLTFLGWRYYEVATRQPHTFVIERASDEIGYQIDINSASWFELSQLEAIGPILAKRIVANRDTNGPFQSIDDLQRVTGIGPRTVERNRRWMRAGATPSD